MVTHSDRLICDFLGLSMDMQSYICSNILQVNCMHFHFQDESVGICAKYNALYMYCSGRAACTQYCAMLSNANIKQTWKHEVVCILAFRRADLATHKRQMVHHESGVLASSGPARVLSASDESHVATEAFFSIYRTIHLRTHA
jgi:hypothetical protein